jgi:hypothetical protein
MPTIYLNWGNLSENYARPYLYRYNGASWVQRGTGVWAVQHGWGDWYRDDNGQRIAGWTWGSQSAGWYAIQVKFQSYYTASRRWGPVEYGWADTNQFDAVGSTMCRLGGNRRGQPRPPLPPARHQEASEFRVFSTCHKGRAADGQCEVGSDWGGSIKAYRGTPDRYRLCVQGPRRRTCRRRPFDSEGSGWAAAWRWLPSVPGRYRFTWKVDGEFAGSDRLKLRRGD